MKNIFLIFFGVLTALLLLGVLEIGARVFFPRMQSPLYSHVVLNHIWRPGGSFVHQEFATRGIPPYLHKYNSQGWLEEYNIAKKKPEENFRIFYVGDSFTEGTCPMDQSVPSRIEQKLNADLSESRKRFEVINTGTSSYSPMIFYLLLKTEILQYDPDLVVISIDMTDVFDDSVYQTTAVYDENGDLIGCPIGSQLKGKYRRTAEGLIELKPAERITLYLRRRLQLVNLVLQIFEMKYKRNDQPREAKKGTYEWCMKERPEGNDADVDRSMSFLEKSVKLLKDRNIPVLVTGVPHLEHFEGTFTTYPFQRIKQATESSGGIYFDSYEGLIAKGVGDNPAQYYIQNDMHFHLEGYRLWAEVHYDALLPVVEEVLEERS